MTAVTTIAGGVGPDSHQHTHIATATTTVCKSGKGTLHRLVIGERVAAGVITLYDNTSAAAPIIGVITAPGTLLSDPPVGVEYGVHFTTGLTIVTTEADDITVVWD